MEARTRPLVTRSRLIQDLSAAGIEAGMTVMLHVSVKAIGWIVGGPDVVLDALLGVLTPAGTLMMYVDWEGSTSEIPGLPPAEQAVYLAEAPAFDPARSRAYRPWSILTEYLRSRPGAHRSANPEASMAAVGRQAEWLTADHPLQYGYGPGSPLAKLCAIKGKVLLLGAPTDTLTVLHYAEHLADIPNKRVVRYPVPILESGQRAWVEIEEFDTSEGIVDWDGDGDMFAVIATDYEATGRVRIGRVGDAATRLYDADDLVTFGRTWIERSFG